MCPAYIRLMCHLTVQLHSLMSDRNLKHTHSHSKETAEAPIAPTSHLKSSNLILFPICIIPPKLDFSSQNEVHNPHPRSGPRQYASRFSGVSPSPNSASLLLSNPPSLSLPLPTTPPPLPPSLLPFPLQQCCQALTVPCSLAIMTAGQTPCTTTLPRVATLNVGPTSTRYLATTTSTSHVNCSGCNLVVETFGGPGPVSFPSLVHVAFCGWEGRRGRGRRARGMFEGDC